MALRNVTAIRPTEGLRKLLVGADSSSAIQVIDASWYMPASNIKGKEVYNRKRIPGAKFFDLDECVDKQSTLPHMMPSHDFLLEYLDQIGIQTEPTQDILVYDTLGMFSSPRLWYMLKVAGFQNVAVLEGGLPGWDAAGFQIDTQSSRTEMVSNSAIRSNKSIFKPLENSFVDKISVKKASERSSPIIDARSAERFAGTVPEPREGLRRGSIPFSVNIPFVSVIDENGFFLSKSTIEQVFKRVGVDPKSVKETNQELIFSCGSGVTAVVPLLALVHHFDVSIEQCKVYDGAFSEWGGLDDENYPVTIA